MDIDFLIDDVEQQPVNEKNGYDYDDDSEERENEDDDDGEDDEDQDDGMQNFNLLFDEKTSMPPPPPQQRAASAPTPRVSQTTIASGATQPVAVAAIKKPAPIDNSSRRLRVNEVHVELSPSVITTPVKQEGTSNSNNVQPLTLDHYEVAKHLAVDQRAAELAEGTSNGTAAMSTKIGDTAAQVNHYLIAVSDARERLDPAILSQLPYTVQTTGAHIGRSFYMAALTTAPHLSRPVSELTDVLRRLASEARCVRRAHIEAMTRTPRLREETCANKEGCVSLSFADYYNRPLPDRRPLVAFLYEDEMAMLRTAPAVLTPEQMKLAGDKRPKTRAEWTALWRSRACVQCMIRAGNRLVTNLRCKNQAVDARLYLAVPFYVEVDVAGEYPIGATLGPGKRVFESLVFNLPRFSELGWMTTIRADATVSAAASTGAVEEVVHYVNVSVPPFPVPEETLRAHMTQGFSGAL